MLQIPKLAFWIYIFLFLTVLFQPRNDKRDDFDFDKVYFLFLDDDVPRSASYISQPIRFARVCSNVSDFNAALNNRLTDKRL